jgi:hypothetical protein
MLKESIRKNYAQPCKNKDCQNMTSHKTQLCKPCRDAKGIKLTRTKGKKT